MKQDGFYISNIDQYRQNIKDYEEAPNGKAYTGIAKEPLMPMENGHGFQGVLLQDEARQLVQCAACGKWMKQIQAGHLKRCSGLTPTEYKKKYGLHKNTCLSSDETRILQAKHARKSVGWANVNKYRNQKKATEAAKKARQTMEYKNAMGTCPEQIKERLKEFILTKRRLPNMKNGGAALIGLLKRRHGTINDGLEFYGLPRRKSLGSTIEYTFSDGTTYFYKTFIPGNFEMLFQLLKKKSWLFNVDAEVREIDKEELRQKHLNNIPNHN